MKRYAYVLVPLLAAAATPALAAEPASRAAAASTLIQSQLESRANSEQTSSDQTRATLARLREALEARKKALKDAAVRDQQGTNGLCSDCPDKADPTYHHSVSEERKVDCIHCIEKAIYA